jgi:ribonuclease HI
MPWRAGVVNGKDVWVEVDAEGELLVRDGRVPVRYSEAEGAKLYGAGRGNVKVFAGAPKELPPGRSDDAPREGGAAARPSTRASAPSGFGSAGTRTAAQAAAAKAAAGDLISDIPASAVICFTDGACKGNPGPTGAGCVVKLPDGQRFERHLALGQGTNNIGELSAVGLALQLLDENNVADNVAVHILTDSKYAIGVLSQGWKAKANVELIADLKVRVKKRKAKLHWVAGHTGVADNERADTLANLGVDESRRALRR